jgi:hypothetical protein
MAKKIYNYELYEIFNDSNIVSYIRVKKIGMDRALDVCE